MIRRFLLALVLAMVLSLGVTLHEVSTAKDAEALDSINTWNICGSACNSGTNAPVVDIQNNLYSADASYALQEVCGKTQFANLSGAFSYIGWTVGIHYPSGYCSSGGRYGSAIFTRYSCSGGCSKFTYTFPTQNPPSGNPAGGWRGTTCNAYSVARISCSGHSSTRSAGIAYPQNQAYEYGSWANSWYTAYGVSAIASGDFNLKYSEGNWGTKFPGSAWTEGDWYYNNVTHWTGSSWEKIDYTFYRKPVLTTTGAGWTMSGHSDHQLLGTWKG